MHVAAFGIYNSHCTTTVNYKTVKFWLYTVLNSTTRIYTHKGIVSFTENSNFPPNCALP